MHISRQITANKVVLISHTVPSLLVSFNIVSIEAIKITNEKNIIDHIRLHINHLHLLHSRRHSLPFARHRIATNLYFYCGDMHAEVFIFIHTSSNHRLS